MNEYIEFPKLRLSIADVFNWAQSFEKVVWKPIGYFWSIRCFDRATYY